MIRQATEAEAATVAKVLALAFAEYRAMYTPRAFAVTTPEPDELRGRWNQGPVWVADQDGDVIGTLSAVVQGRDLYLRSMAVLPASRGMGAGPRLLQHAEEFAQEQGLAQLTLSTTPFLLRAIRLYERSGFQRATTMTDLYGTPLLTMSKRLC
jgi:ribosomal protein S18 acetylase RimI-like enzyme